MALWRFILPDTALLSSLLSVQSPSLGDNQPLVFAMTLAVENSTTSADTPEARRYNRIRRWLGIADAVLGFLLLVVLLATNWSGWLRDLAYRGGFHNYTFAFFLFFDNILLIGNIYGFCL